MERIISKKMLGEFWEIHPSSEQYLKTWYETVKHAKWNSPNEVKSSYAHSIILKDSRIVFNIKGNSFRLVAKFNFEKKWVFIRFVGTQVEYDKIDANKI